MTKHLTYIIFAVMIFCLSISCSKNNDNKEEPITEVREGTCFDGILNGDEVIIDCGGVCPGFCPPNSIGILGGEVIGEPIAQNQVAPLQLDPEVEYRLIGPLLVRDRAILSIPAGTVIKVDPNAGAYIAVAQGGSLLVSGQPDKPVVITSGAENPAPGDWGGIIICGDGPISSSEVLSTDIIDIFYGGSDVQNSSGAIKYLRIEYAGALAENGKNFDALALYGVGKFTGLTNIQTFESLGNGIRFIGGNADAKKLVVTNSGGNSIVVQDDWSGNGESWYLSGIAKSGIEITSNTTEPLLPIETDTIAKVSIVGPAPRGAVRYTNGGGKYMLSNIFANNLILGIDVEGATATEQINMGNLKIDSLQFDNPSIDFAPTNYSGPNTSFYSESITNGAGNEGVKPDWANGWTIGLN